MQIALNRFVLQKLPVKCSMSKRKQPDGNVVRSALKVKGATDQAAFQLLHLGKLAKSLPASLSQYRTSVARELPHDLIVKVPLNDGLYMPVCDLPKLLQRMCEKNRIYGEKLQSLSEKHPGKPCRLVLYIDEVQAGNILAPSSRKKLCLAYGAIVEMGGLGRECQWFNLMAFSHAAVEQVSGGWSRLMKEFVLTIHKQLENGFALQSGDRQPFLCFLKIHAMIGDFDALRCFYDWRGAASIKLCMCCKNIVSRSSELTLFGENLFDQTHARLADCQCWTDEEIENLFDAARLAPMPTKKERETTCKAAGFNVFNYLGHLSHNVSRKVLPISSCIFDVMHLYWSNGLCSWEICQFVSKMEQHGLTLSMLTDAFVATEWHCGDGKTSKYWYRNLLAVKRFSSDSYKGSASDLKALLPLFAFHVTQIFGDDSGMSNEIQSLLALLRICRCLDVLHRNLSENNLTKLQILQEDHHLRYGRAYGLDAYKPKHHFRFHIPSMFRRHGFYIDCFAMEAKHRHFKYTIQNRFDTHMSNLSLYCDKVLQRLSLYALDLLQRQTSPGTLGNPTKKFEAIPAALQSFSLQLSHGRHVQVGHFIIGFCSGIVLHCVQSQDELFLVLEPYVPVSCLIYASFCCLQRLSGPLRCFVSCVMPVPTVYLTHWIHLDRKFCLCILTPGREK